jgi:signal transduction histidine kinase
MWQRLSFRTQLFLPLGAMFLATLIMGGVLLQMFAAGQMAEENEPARQSTGVVAEALNNALRVSDDPRRTLEAFVQALNGSPDIRYHPVEAGPLPHSTGPAPGLRGVPQWFVDLLTIPDLKTEFPIRITGNRVGDIVFSPDLSADIYEKWIGFLALSCLIALLLGFTVAVAFVIVGSVLTPLRALGEGLTRLRCGDYGHVIVATGPAEIRQSCEEANELARTLHRLSEDNRDLLRRLVSLQDDERQVLARELHDELGPLLFGIRAGTVALIEATGEVTAPAEQLMHSVELLQQANRRILDRLRPLYIQELGLERSIRTQLENFRRHAPQIELTATIDPALNRVDGLLSQTVYRVVQEGLTNVLRHARASNAHVEASLTPEELAVEISDDGIGFPAGNEFGRGLTGMLERVRALSGTLQLLRISQRTYVRCRLPVGEPQAEISTS